MTRALTRLCVIGAGLAGLACAVGAAARGVQVRVLESEPRLSVPPAYVDVVPNMLRDLVELGLGDECVRAGFAYRATEFVDRQGRQLYEVPCERLAGARYPAALGLGHAELLSVLESAALSRGATVSRGAGVQGVEPQGDHARVLLADGEVVEADLVILAAGGGSPLRTALFPQAQPLTDLGQTWWYTRIRRPVGLDRPLVAFGAPGQRVVLMPVRHDMAGLALVEPPSASLPSRPALHLRSSLAAFAPRVREVASQLGEDSPVARRPARIGLLSPLSSHGCVIAVGECAHAMPPHLGQSAAQAVEDATVLKALLADSIDGRQVLDGFQRRRGERVRQIQELTATAAQWDIEPSPKTDLSELRSRLSRTVAQPA